MGSEQNAEDTSLPPLLLAHTASEEVVSVSPGYRREIYKAQGARSGHHDLPQDPEDLGLDCQF